MDLAQLRAMESSLEAMLAEVRASILQALRSPDPEERATAERENAATFGRLMAQIEDYASPADEPALRRCLLDHFQGRTALARIALDAARAEWQLTRT